MNLSHRTESVVVENGIRVLTGVADSLEFGNPDFSRSHDQQSGQDEGNNPEDKPRNFHGESPFFGTVSQKTHKNG